MFRDVLLRQPQEKRNEKGYPGWQDVEWSAMFGEMEATLYYIETSWNTSNIEIVHK